MFVLLFVFRIIGRRRFGKRISNGRRIVAGTRRIDVLLRRVGRGVLTGGNSVTSCRKSGGGNGTLQRLDAKRRLDLFKGESGFLEPVGGAAFIFFEERPEQFCRRNCRDSPLQPQSGRSLKNSIRRLCQVKTHTLFYTSIRKGHRVHCTSFWEKNQERGVVKGCTPGIFCRRMV